MYLYLYLFKNQFNYLYHLPRSEADKLWPLACVFLGQAEQNFYIFKGREEGRREVGKGVLRGLREEKGEREKRM